MELNNYLQGHPHLGKINWEYTEGKDSKGNAKWVARAMSEFLLAFPIPALSYLFMSVQGVEYGKGESSSQKGAREQAAKPALEALYKLAT